MNRAGKTQVGARSQPEFSVQHKGGRDSRTGWWIGLREKLLDMLSGIQADEVLNHATAVSISEPGGHLAEDLKRALDAIKITAVDAGGAQVNYAALRDSPAYQHFRTSLSPSLMHIDPGKLETREERLAFWINLYNALVMDAVILLGVRGSVVEGRLGLITFFRRAAYNVAGQRISLDEIENGILRGNQGHPFIPGKQFKNSDRRMDWVVWPPERRIHFTLNCASKSCPPIQVYSADQLEAQLDLAARNFVDSSVEVNVAKRELVVSSIFQWFKGDFGGKAGILTFLVDHLPGDERREWLMKNQDTLQLRFARYDWGLNTA